MEHMHKPGDACVDCEKLGLTHTLRYFHISLEERILKCESNGCLYPHNAEISSDEDEAVATQCVDAAAPAQAAIANAIDSVCVDDGDALIADLLRDSNFVELDATAATSMPSISYDFTHFNMPSLTDDIDDAKPVTSAAANTATQHKETKQKIDIQSVQTFKFEVPPAVDVKHNTGDSNATVKVETTPQQTNTNANAAADDDEIPKARISRYFTNLNMNTKQRTQRIKKRRNNTSTQSQARERKDAKEPPSAAQRIRTDDVLKLLQRKNTT